MNHIDKIKKTKIRKLINKHRILVFIKVEFIGRTAILANLYEKSELKKTIERTLNS